MKKLTDRQRRNALAAIAAIPDEQIVTSDIPEFTDEQLSNAVRGAMYRPVKKPVTMRLDADVIHWLKSEGPGYQTKANRLLRAEMLQLPCTLREAPAVVRDKDCAKARQARNSTPPARVAATFAGSDCSRTHDFNPRFGCLSCSRVAQSERPPQLRNVWENLETPASGS
jgi:uncharacterized protein (DUF4415 family)